jgi:hypothetical protein
MGAMGVRNGMGIPANDQEEDRHERSGVLLRRNSIFLIRAAGSLGIDAFQLSLLNHRSNVGGQIFLPFPKNRGQGACRQWLPPA